MMQFSPDPDPLKLPERYRLAVTGRDMAPAYPEGSIVTAARDVPCEALDVVGSGIARTHSRIRAAPCCGA